MMSSSGATPLIRMEVKEKEAERLKKIQFVCDRCGAVLEKTAIKIIPNVVELDGEDILHPVDEATHGMHFCAACTDALLKFLLPENKPPPKPKEKPARRRRLDAGRVMALHNAGWSNEDIAADIRADPEQVRQCIYYQKYKKKSPSVADGEEQT